jgi:TDG/mug DNA glycosylase family protein
VGFSREQLNTFRGGTVPDLLGPDVRLLFVGINPGLQTVAVQAHFARRGNRFYPALFRSGILDRLIDASTGFRPEDRAHLESRGVGITSLVAGASARADELGADQLVEGAGLLRARVRVIRPKVVAMLGISAYRVAFNQPKAVLGPQAGGIEGAELWVVPNPSGLNAHASLADLVAAYREPAIAAGLQLFPDVL